MASRKKSSSASGRSAKRVKPARASKPKPKPIERPKRGTSAASGPRRVREQPSLVTHVTAGKHSTLNGNSGLNSADVAAFEQMLLDKRSQLAGDVQTLRNDALGKNRQDAAGDLSSMPIHMADLGTDNYEQEFTLGLIEGERQVLLEIDEALERIKRGTFGLCIATGKPIGKARLRAKPWAKYSYEYALAQERGRTRRI